MSNRNYNEAKKYTIYIILHPNTKQFYVHFSATNALRNSMETHYNLRNKYTKELFSTYKETIYPPEMYKLQECEITRTECFSKVYIWIKYFMSNGYISLNHVDENDAANNLYEENMEEYNRIKDIRITEIISKTSRLFPYYGREKLSKNTNANEKKQVKLICTNEEYETIKANAKRYEKTVSAFIKEVATNCVVVDINYKAITDNLKEINQIKTRITAIIKMLVETNQAYPADIEQMIFILKELNESQKTMLELTIKEHEKIRKSIKKLIKKQNE